ncbi:hypothetical protein QTI66_07095 [Variovorax sp. J22R133]|uniref:hypothetical protein n=1 Tax=Variovorax brevis TaxID=3053503 RepID=UPI002574CB74|nr:hypothetical protein [Variovorax sp. J22R133]MDM0111908.1 hypothetical protein [Variovorax sp. J22R133]
MKSKLNHSTPMRFWQRGAHPMSAPLPAKPRGYPPAPTRAANGHLLGPPTSSLRRRIAAWWTYHFVQIAVCRVQGLHGPVYFRANVTPLQFRNELHCMAFKTEFMTRAAFDKLPSLQKA